MEQDMDAKEYQDDVNADDPSTYFTKGEDEAVQDEKQPQTDDVSQPFGGTEKQNAVQGNAVRQDVTVKHNYPKATPQVNRPTKTNNPRARKPAKRKRKAPFWKSMPQIDDESIPKSQLLPFVIVLAVLAVLFVVMTVVVAMPTAARLTLTAIATAIGLGWLLYSALRK